MIHKPDHRGTAPLLKCRGVTKAFGSLVAVDKVDLDLWRGETVGIGGPNGAGKTTFFDIISGLGTLTSGSVEFLGKSIVGLPAYKICHLGMARTFQLNSGFDGLSVFENLLVAASYSRRGSPGILFTGRADNRRARDMLERMEIGDQADHLVANVPVLTRKKLMVATALMSDPEILLLDEPVGGLTPAETDEFMALMDNLKNDGLMLVFIEHVMRFLTAVADRALIMHQGRIIYDGPPLGLSADSTVREIYLGTSGIPAAGAAQ